VLFRFKKSIISICIALSLSSSALAVRWPLVATGSVLTIASLYWNNWLECEIARSRVEMMANDIIAQINDRDIFERLEIYAQMGSGQPVAFKIRKTERAQKIERKQAMYAMGIAASGVLGGLLIALGCQKF
jgi:hypothetical protein